MKNICILASGSGTNAENIIRYFQENKQAKVNILLANKENAFALTRAKRLGVPAMVFNRADMYESDRVLKIMKNYSADLIILAGFLWLIPKKILDAFPDRILNIHPALLPQYGGKGMYGSRVHEAVIKNQDKKSGITIHLVNQEYDSGDIIFQAQCPVHQNDTPDSLASRIHELEYAHYPRVILEYLDRL